MPTYNNPAHGNPHTFSPTKAIRKDESENSPCEASKIVDWHNDSQQAITRVPNCVQEVLISDNTTKHSLIVSFQSN